MDVDLDRTYIRAGAAKRRRKRQVGIFFHIQVGREDRAYRSGHGGMIAMPTATPIDRAGVKTGGTAYTLEGAAKILSAEMDATTVVDEDDREALAG